MIPHVLCCAPSSPFVTHLRESFTDFVDFTSERDRLSSCCFTGIDASHDTDITGFQIENSRAMRFVSPIILISILL